MYFSELNKSILKDLTLYNNQFEEKTDFFDIVPDSRLFFKSGIPVLLPRFKTKGLEKIANYYLKDNIIIDLIEVKIYFSSSFAISSNIARYIFQENDFIKNKISFDNMSNNSWKSLIVNVLNKFDRTMHSIPLIYGIKDFRKKIIILDRCYEFFNEIDQDCSVFCLFHNLKLKFFDADIYLNTQIIQADQHSCGTIAVYLIKKILKDVNFLNAIFKTAAKKDILFENMNLTYYNFKMPLYILRIQQVKNSFRDLFCYKEMIKLDKAYIAYNPDEILDFNLISENNIKNINILLLVKSHIYAKYILNEISKDEKIALDKEKIKYNPDIWINKILNYKDDSFMKKIRNISLKLKDNKINQMPQEGSIFRESKNNSRLNLFN